MKPSKIGYYICLTMAIIHMIAIMYFGVVAIEQSSLLIVVSVLLNAFIAYCWVLLGDAIKNHK